MEQTTSAKAEQPVHNPLPAAWESQFESQIAKHNRKLFLILSAFVIFVQIFNLVHVLFLSSKGLSTINNRIYFSLYVSLLTVAMFALLIYWKAKTLQQKPWFSQISFAYCLFFCLWTASITVMDLQKNTNITAYAIAVVSIAILFYLKPWQAAVLFLGGQLYLFLMIPYLQLDANGNGILINSTILSVISLFMSITRYHNQYDTVKNAQIIVSQTHKIQEINEELGRLVITDPLTGLYNRRFLEQNLLEHWPHHIDKEQSLTVMMADIDDFKHYNDTFGHPAGDCCMVELAKTLRYCTEGRNCYVIRYGGEEFLMVFFGLEQADALVLANHIRSCTEMLRIERPITLSIGICSCLLNDTCSLQNFIQWADDALYQAKNNGKNQVVFHSAP